MIPDDLVDHYLAKNGFQCPDEGLVGISLQFYFILFVAYMFVYWFNRRIRLVAVATQKFVADVASERKATNRGTAKAKQEAAKVNKEGNSWTVSLRFRESSGSYYIRGGWRRFCRDNRRKIGDLMVFNLVGDGKTSPMICICPEEECSELVRKAKRRSKWVASSSSRRNRFVTISLIRYNFRSSKLILPATFMKINGIKRQNEIILMDKHGVRWVTKLVKDGSKYGKRGLGKGWKDFCEANDVLKIGEPFMLELIWENTLPVLKFGFKVKVETICD
ncbi:hypothetical protein F2Q68_00037703 [Brassica cretica]|uniref:TF-B3 domain-containing protein n=1 Tax=Brassica cretica TaxID=69181 RepID=A0A8S9H152_BRACR|nr:hypothetical protein F2Q68_00037703 [Brassica cretica]